MIAAHTRTDDFAVEVDFDAQPYFEKADDQALARLIGCGFENDYPADHVAKELAGKNPDIQAMFTYLDARNNGAGPSVGFEVSVDEEQAFEWIVANRPQVLAKAGLDLADFDLAKCEQCGAIRDRDDLTKADKKAPMLCGACIGQRITWLVTRDGNTLELPAAIDPDETGVIGFIDGPSNDHAWNKAWQNQTLEVKEKDGRELVRPQGSSEPWTPLHRKGKRMSDTLAPALTRQQEPWYQNVDTLAGLAKLVAHLEPDALASAAEAAGVDYLEANELRYRAQAIANSGNTGTSMDRSVLERDLNNPEVYTLTGDRIAYVHVWDPKNPHRGMSISINDEGQDGPYLQVYPMLVTPAGKMLVGDENLRIEGFEWGYDDELDDELLEAIRAQDDQ